MIVKPKRRTYAKPALERISLIAEAAAAVPNCKRSNGGGKNRSFFYLLRHCCHNLGMSMSVDQ